MNGSFPVFTTKHLVFRQLQPQDAYGIYHLFSDKDAMLLDGGETMNTMQEAHQFIQHYSQGPPNTDFIRWAVTSRDQRYFFGTGGFHNWDRQSNTAEIGGELSKEFWNKGIGSEGYLGIANFGFEHMGLHRIYAYVNPQNRAAKRLLGKSPFRKEGYLRECRRWGNRYVDLELYGLLKKEWESFKLNSI